MATQASHRAEDRSRPWIERRRTERCAAMYRVARVVTKCGRQQLCLIRNISSGGLMLETHGQFAQGEQLRIEPKTGGCLSGVISWSQSNLAGVAFEEPLDIEGFLSAEGRSRFTHAPRGPRIETQRQARVKVGPMWWKVRLCDLSQGGAKIESDMPISIGEQIVLEVDDLMPMPGHVRWTRDNRLGLTFSSALPFGELSRWTDRCGGDVGAPGAVPGDARDAAAGKRISGI